MNEERRKILEMLSAGKITVEEAEKLMAAVSAEDGTERDGSVKASPRYLRVQVEPGPGSERQERVNIRVPMKLIRAGLKFAAFIPPQAQNNINQALREKGIGLDLNRIKPEDLEELVTHLDDLTVEVEGREKVRIFCE